MAFDLLAITESKLTRNIRDEDIMISGYKFFRKDRPVEDGGGCVLYCAESLDIVEIQNCSAANLNIGNYVYLQSRTKVLRHLSRTNAFYRCPSVFSKTVFLSIA